MSSSRRFLGLGLAVGLVGGLLVGTSLAQPRDASAASPSVAPSAPSTGAAAGVPGAAPAIATAGPGVAEAGTAVAYPYFAGSPGIAPDHTIVVNGVGQAQVQADGSNRAAAQKSAIGLALADAKAQADAIAAATGLGITSVLSVSASVSPSGPIPMMANGSGTIACPATPPTARGAILPQPVCPPYDEPWLTVSVTVAYRVG